MSEQKIDKIHTPCKSCGFAKYEGITQTGCYTGYLDKYKKAGSEILEAYDDEKEFFIINNRKCISYRENKWFEKYNLLESSIEEKVNKFNQTNHIYYCLAINLINISTLDTISQIVKNINNSQIKPKKIIIIRYKHHAKQFSYDVLRNLLKELDSNIEWRIQNMMENNEPEEYIIYNISINNKKQRFICYMNNYTEDFAKIIDKANDMVCNTFEFFTAVSDKTYNCMLYSGSLYRYSLIEYKKNILHEKDKFTVV